MTERDSTEELSTADLIGRSPRREAEQTQRDERAVGTQRTEIADREDAERAPLFGGGEAEQFRTRWSDVQAAFVDDPRQAVERADQLVAEVMQRLATVFADERENLERQWGQGEDVSTEDLRIALRRYRSFFDRLLSV